MRSIWGPIWIVLASAIVLTAGPAAAQTPPAANAPNTSKAAPRDAPACGPGGTHATVGQGNEVVVRKPRDETLSSKLAQSEGVICPPTHVDPEIHAPVPQGGLMPVIPPPGGPGGDQTVQPK
ncbi:MAG: hypothetical protein JSR61_00735 [Proteobacteria bacterium]|nr:hypothetical protein [Pseudomonadota bacterium]